jgi:hypothetical protein
MVNRLEFAGAERRAPQALRAGERIAELKRRLGKTGVPTVYINDNYFGEWRVSFLELVDRAAALARNGVPSTRRSLLKTECLWICRVDAGDEGPVARHLLRARR